MPSFGRKRTSRVSFRHTTAASCACSSFSEKYQWPEVASLRFEISPSTQTSRNSVSSTPWMRSVSSETVSARRRIASGFGAAALREGTVGSLAGGRLRVAGGGLVAEVEALLAHAATVILIWAGGPSPGAARYDRWGESSSRTEQP